VVSGDWVTPHLNGVRDMEKPPLLFWLMGSSFRIFGVHDWSARLPLALGAILLCLFTCQFGAWAFGRRVGVLSGLVLGTCVGLYLFTRVMFLDTWLAVAVAAALYCFLHAMEPEEGRARLWSCGIGVSLGIGILAKGLIALVVPAGAICAYLLLTRQFRWSVIGKQFRPGLVFSIAALIAAPWHILAALRNPPLFAWTLKSVQGQYHGFLWFYFINEQLLRFLNIRYPRDYSTVPRPAFWMLNLVWLFPWSVYFPAVTSLRFKADDRAGRARLLCACWAAFLLIFFTFSTTQEYYVLSCFPALAMLLASALDSDSVWVARGNRFLTAVLGVAALAIVAVLFAVRHVPTPGDISTSLTQHPDDYSLSTGHFHDLSIASFAYLRWPLLLAFLALAIGLFGSLRERPRPIFALVAMMILFEFAARQAMAVFDPYLSSQPLAAALMQLPEGQLIVDGHYYPFSSVFFYAQRPALLLNGRVNDLEYGSNAPDVPPVYIDDRAFAAVWNSSRPAYFITDGTSISRLKLLVDSGSFVRVASSGGKFIFANQSASVAKAGPLTQNLGH